MDLVLNNAMEVFMPLNEKPKKNTVEKKVSNLNDTGESNDSNPR